MMNIIDVSYVEILQLRRSLNLPIRFEDIDGRIFLYLTTSCNTYRAEVMTEEEKADFEQKKQYMNRPIEVEPFVLVTPNLLTTYEFLFSPPTFTRVNIKECWLACSQLSSLPHVTISMHNVHSHKQVVLPSNFLDCFFLAEQIESIDLGFSVAFKFKFSLRYSLHSKCFLHVKVDKNTIEDVTGNLVVIFRGEATWDF